MRSKYSFEIGRKIRQERERLMLSQDRLAEVLGCSQSDISKLEGGRKVLTFAQVLEMVNIGFRYDSLIPSATLIMSLDDRSAGGAGEVSNSAKAELSRTSKKAGDTK